MGNMKQIEKISENKNYTAVNIDSLNELIYNCSSYFNTLSFFLEECPKL